MTDRKLICKDCLKVFVYTVGEQKFFEKTGIKEDPIRCPECRKAKKKRIAAAEKRKEKHNEK